MVHLIGDDASLQRAYKRSAESTQKFDRQMSQTTRGAAAGTGAFRSMGRSIAFASGSFLGAAGLTAALKSSIDAASNLNEQTNKSRAIFKGASSTVEDFARTTARSMGIANDQALEAAGTFGNLFTTVGLGVTQNANLSTSLVKLAADLASFNNASPEEALDALRSGLIGEAEPLRRFGVLLSETRVQQEAMRETGKKTAQSLTDQEKLLARYNLILKDTAPAQGDFAKTSKGLANQQRILAAQLRDSSAALGKNLEPALLTAIGLTTRLIDKVNDLIAAFKRVPGSGISFTDILKKVPGSDITGVDLIKAYVNRVFGSVSPIAPSKLAGQNVSDRVPGLAPGGAGFMQRILQGTTGRQRASLTFQMSMLQEQLAKAELTASQRDDRATLILMQSLLKRRISATKDLKLRTQLYEDLGSIQNQIQGIDDKAAADRKDAHDKELAAQKKKREALAEHNRKLREAWQAQLAKIREAVAEVRSEFGQLPFEASPTGILGITGQSAKSFVGAYVNQTRAFVAFYNDLSRIRKMGAPRGLVDQLRGLGPDAAGLIHSLGRHPGQLNRLIRAFGERERVVQQIAHADIHARNVVVHVAGSRIGATSASSRRGPHAGIPTSIGAWASGGHS